MATTIFLAFCGLAVAFLLYVLVHLWKEGHPPKNGFRPSEAEVEAKWRDWAEVAVLTHPVSPAAQGGTAVIPFPVTRKVSTAHEGRLSGTEVPVGAAKRISIR